MKVESRFFSFAESLLREVLFKVGVSINARDTAIPWGGAGDFRSYNFIRVSYTNVALAGTTTIIHVDVALATGSAYKTYDEVVEALLLTLVDKLFTNDPRYDLSGWTFLSSRTHAQPKNQTGSSAVEWSAPPG